MSVKCVQKTLTSKAQKGKTIAKRADVISEAMWKQMQEIAECSAGCQAPGALPHQDTQGSRSAGRCWVLRLDLHVKTKAFPHIWVKGQVRNTEKAGNSESLLRNTEPVDRYLSHFPPIHVLQEHSGWMGNMSTPWICWSSREKKNTTKRFLENSM